MLSFIRPFSNESLLKATFVAKSAEHRWKKLILSPKTHSSSLIRLNMSATFSPAYNRTKMHVYIWLLLQFLYSTKFEIQTFKNQNNL